MPRKRYKPEEIVAKLRQVDVLVSQGQSLADAIRQIGVSEVTSSAVSDFGLPRSGRSDCCPVLAAALAHAKKARSIPAGAGNCAGDAGEAAIGFAVP
jgi:hypothetical protein